MQAIWAIWQGRSFFEDAEAMSVRTTWGQPTFSPVSSKNILANRLEMKKGTFYIAGEVACPLFFPQEEIGAWSEDITSTQRGVDWQMKIDDARCKLKTIYPKILV